MSDADQQSRAEGKASAKSEGGSLEGLVDGPEPAHVGAGSEEDQPQDGHAEVGGAAAATHPRQATNQVNSQSGRVH